MRTIDLDLLRQVTTDALRVYEATRRSEQLLAEAQRAVQCADALLRGTSLAFLADDVTIVDSRGQTDRSAREAMIAAYIEIQKAYAEFKDALYQLMEAHLSRREWEEAYRVLRALEKVDPEYRDCALIKPSVEFARGIAKHLQAGRLAQAIGAVVEQIKAGNTDPYLDALAGELACRAADGEAWDGIRTLVEALHARKIDLRRWLEDHQVPFVEIRAELVEWESEHRVWDEHFPRWCAESVSFQVVQAGKNLMDRYKNSYKISIHSPAGLFIKFQLEYMLPDEALSNKELVFGLVICKRAEGQAAGGGKSLSVTKRPQRTRRKPG